VTIFDFIAQILFKTRSVNAMTADDESNFASFIFNRWCSMYSDKICLLCNRLGKYAKAFDAKRDIITLYTAVLPKVPVKKITYFKRKKTELNDAEADKANNIKLIAAAHEISTREVKEYYNLLNN